MKKLFWLAAIVLGLTLAAAGIPARADTSNHPRLPLTTDKNSVPQNEALYVEKSFSTTQATVQGYVIHSWSQASSAFETLSELKTKADSIQQDLHVVKAKIVSRSDHNQNFYEVYGVWRGDTQVSVTLTSFRFPNGPGSTVLVIRANSQTGRLDDFVNDHEAIWNAVVDAGCTPQISSCIEGFTNARMSGVHSDRLISQALQSVHAQRVEGVQSDLVTSISAYSPDSPDFILTGGHKMNLQVAIHYDAYHHRTNVIVGSPVITVTY